MAEIIDKASDEITAKNVTSNLIWRFLERFGAYLVGFIISIVLARILDPETYGTVALMTVFITFFDIFITGGFGTSLVRDKNATKKDFNTMLIFNGIISIAFYSILFFIAPLISKYYSNNTLTSLIRISGLTLLISGIKNLQYSYVAKKMQFKKFFFSTIGGTIFSGILGILLAIFGFGPWALVIQGLTNHFIDSVILWFTIDWKPKFEFDIKIVKKHFNFGWKILASKIMYTIANDLQQLVIGKRYSESDLAFYNRGKSYPNIIGQNIYSSINSVILPVLSKKQDNDAEARMILYKAISLSFFIVLPMCIGFFIVSENFVLLLLGQKWLQCVPYLKIFCVVVFLNSLESSLSQVSLAKGRAGLGLFGDLWENVIKIGLLLIAIPFGVKAIAYSVLLSSLINIVIFLIISKISINTSFRHFFTDNFETFILNILMGIAAFAISRIPMPNYLILFAQIFVGVTVYIFGAIILENKNLLYFKNLLSKLFSKK